MSLQLSMLSCRGPHLSQWENMSITTTFHIFYIRNRYALASQLIIVNRFDVESVVLEEVLKLVVDKYWTCHFLSDLERNVTGT